MTDYMYISFTVTGTAEEIDRFREGVRGQGNNGEDITIDFARLIPIPEEITDPFTARFVQREDNQLSYYPPWCVQNWGASSNALFTEIREDRDGVIQVQFDTSGGFAYLILAKIVASFPELIFDGSAFENVEEFTWQEGDYREAFGEDADDDDHDSYAPTTGAASS